MRQLQLGEIQYGISKLGNVSIFQYLNDNERRELLKICTIHEFDPDEKIINQGETSNCFYAILSGTVNVTVTDKNLGKEVFLSVIGEGEFFGEAGIFNDAKRSANITAASAAEIICIDRNDFFNFISQFTGAGVKILMLFVNGLLKKLNSSNQELAFERREVMDQSAIDQFLKNLK
jgi:cAMP-binding proteins - catabolite gene activator and regulatory subunit of cAMP-dependent protein kinases